MKVTEYGYFTAVGKNGHVLVRVSTCTVFASVRCRNFGTRTVTGYLVQFVTVLKDHASCPDIPGGDGTGGLA